ncbi:MAG: DUF998 domain-containing protein [Thermoleophilia bacterium]|nr:DUF998 domain-containing protein [Thermoleophilia bacterium]MDH3725236.1 DUF998 domain-containing protein [Thermoleophilia bacterium]
MTTPADATRGFVPPVGQLGFIGLIGVAYSAAAVVALHFLDTDLDPVEDFISEYAVGDYGWLMKSAFFAVSCGTLAIAGGLRRSLRPSRRATAAVVLMSLAGVGFFVAGIFDTDTPNASGDIDNAAAGVAHDFGSSVVFLSVIIAAFVLWGVFASDPPWHGLSRTALWFAIAMTMSRVVTLAIPEGGPVGLPQRVLAATMMIWLAILGWEMRRLAPTERST